MSRIIAVGLSTTLQKTITFTNLKLDSVNRSTGYRIDASGKAVNAARVLTQLSPGIATNVCPLGADNAKLFLELAAKDHMTVEWTPVPGRVRYCYTLLEPGTGRATELVVSEPVGTEDFSAASEDLLALILKNLAGAEALLLAGSRPAAYPSDMCARICKLAKDEGLAVMADFHGKDLSLTLETCAPDIVKINEEEFCGTFGYSFPLPEAELSALIAERSSMLGNTIVVTRGSKDTFAGANGVAFRQRVNAVTALNAIGCGDSFSAGFLYSWIADRDTKAALEKGSWCASRNALNMRPGSIRDPDEEGEGLW
jgi:fructose-1-phosphate kinase PfkB-like protein